MENKFTHIDYKQLFQQLGSDFIKKINDAQIERDSKDFLSLKEQLEKGKYYLCGKSIDYIDESAPCFHWLINAKAKKKQLAKVLNAGKGLLHMYGYLTWVANSTNPFVNIDDTADGIDINKIFETTIKYKEFEWSFSLAHSDFEGHKGTKSDYPHFHLQMKKNGNVVIKFNDYHIPFSDNDIRQIEMKRQGVLEFIPGLEAGINALKKINPQEFNNLLSRSNSNEECSFRTRTVLCIPKDKEAEIYSKINELRSSTLMTAPQIAEYLNQLYGYGIEYETVSTPISSVNKSHRN